MRMWLYFFAHFDADADADVVVFFAHFDPDADVDVVVFFAHFVTACSLESCSSELARGASCASRALQLARNQLRATGMRGITRPASQAASQLSGIMLQGAGILGIMRLVCCPLAPSCGAFGKPLRSSDGKCGLR